MSQARGTQWSRAIAGYVVYMQAAGRAEGTVKLHLHYLSLLRGRLRSPWSATTAQLREVLATRGWSAETRKSCRTVLRGFYSWGQAEGLVTVNPAASLASIRVPRGVPKPTPTYAVEQLLSDVDARLVHMVKLGLAGLRRSEIAAVHRDHLLDDLLLVRGKGGVERLVPIVDDELLDWLRGREAWAFPSPYGGHLSPAHVGVLLSRALPRGWSGHSLRHWAGTHAHEGTGDLMAVMQLLGHSRPDVTQIYVLIGMHRVRAAAAAAASAVPRSSDRRTAAA